jgi:hypothetical protein
MEEPQNEIDQAIDDVLFGPDDEQAQPPSDEDTRAEESDDRPRSPPPGEDSRFEENRPRPVRGDWRSDDQDHRPRSRSRDDWRSGETDDAFRRGNAGRRQRGPATNWLLIGILGGGAFAVLVAVYGVYIIFSPAPPPPPFQRPLAQGPNQGMPNFQNPNNFNAAPPNFPPGKIGGRRVKKEEFVWRTHKSAKDRYQIEFPGPASELNLGQGRVCQVGFGGSDLEFGVVVADMQPGDPRTVEEMHNECVKEAAKEFKRQFPTGRVVQQEPAMLGGEEAIEFKLQANAYVLIMRACVHDQILLVATVGGSDLQDHGAAVDRFMNSFRFLEGPQVADNKFAEKISLAEARRGFKTKLIRKTKDMDPVDEPPAELRVVRYPSPVGNLAAYLCPPAKQKKKRPAIIWIFGGFSNGIGSTAWDVQPADNDQSASAFRKAGIAMMYPSFRGGNDNPGFMECCLGEVDDVLAAADFLAKQDFIDPQRIYLGGHSTGGTLALLAAASSGRFRAVFSFGPVEDIGLYGQAQLPFNINDDQERRLRSPIRWLSSIKTPTFVFEGHKGNASSLKEMSRVCKNPAVKFTPLKGADHFSYLAPMTQLVSEKIQRDTGGVCNIEFTNAEISKLFR